MKSRVVIAVDPTVTAAIGAITAVLGTALVSLVLMLLVSSGAGSGPSSTSTTVSSVPADPSWRPGACAPFCPGSAGAVR